MRYIIPVLLALTFATPSHADYHRYWQIRALTPVDECDWSIMSTCLLYNSSLTNILRTMEGFDYFSSKEECEEKILSIYQKAMELDERVKARDPKLTFGHFTVYPRAYLPTRVFLECRYR